MEGIHLRKIQIKEMNEALRLWEEDPDFNWKLKMSCSLFPLDFVQVEDAWGMADVCGAFLWRE